MKIGIIGLPNAGKSTIFNALVHARVPVQKHPFTTIEPNVGMVHLPEPRLERLAALFGPERTVPASVKFTDIAGLVAGASHGEGLGNQFLAAIRETAALAHVVRLFPASDVAHVLGGIDPVRDIEVVKTELMLSDLDLVEKRLGKILKGRQADPRLDEELKEVLESVKCRLERGEECRGTPLAEKARALLPDLPLFSLKPVIYVGNVGEDDLGKETPALAALREKARREGAGLVALCGKLEEEVGDLPPEEQGAFRESLGLQEPGLALLAAAAKELLGLVVFFTKEGVEVRAWTVRKGTTARKAAGEVHTEIEKGFIKAEVVSFADLNAAGSPAEAKRQGLLRFEGAEYPVREGDVIRFHFK